MAIEIPKLATLLDDCLKDIPNRPAFRLQGDQFTNEEIEQWRVWKEQAMWRLIEDTRDKLAAVIAARNKDAERIAALEQNLELLRPRRFKK